MFQYWMIVVFFACTNGVFTENSETPSVQSVGDAYRYLNRFGYNPCTDASGTLCNIKLSSMLRDFQTRFQLNVTGTLDEPTKREMSRPRCGNTDPPLESLQLTAASLTAKWAGSVLRWSLRNYPANIGRKDTEKIIQEAFDLWLKYIPLTIKQVCPTCPTNFSIEFSQNRHNDDYPFDGPGKTLAHAFFPQDGRIHFDADESWTNSFDGKNINLYIVAVHEIGHALGLQHVYEKASVMYPNYQLFDRQINLPMYDRLLIQRIYSPAPVTTTSSTKKITKFTVPFKSKTTTTKHPQTTRSILQTTHICQLFVDAAFDFPDDSFHILDTGMLRRYFPAKQIWDSKIIPFKNLYHRLPKRIAAGVYDFDTNQILIFTSQRVYQYRVRYGSYRIDYQQDTLLPEHLQSTIVGAIFYQDMIYVVKTKSMQQLDLELLQRKTTERKLSQAFPGLTGAVKTAFTFDYLHHFFTSDGLVYVWDEQFNKWETFAKPMKTGWFACSNKTV